MANMFGMLLAAVLIILFIARCMKDAKAFGKLMAIFTIGLIVGAGSKLAASSLTANTPEKTIVVSTESVPMHSTVTPFVTEPAVTTYQDCASEDTTERDSVVTEVEGLPTERIESAYEDDS